MPSELVVVVVDIGEEEEGIRSNGWIFTRFCCRGGDWRLVVVVSANDAFWDDKNVNRDDMSKTNSCRSDDEEEEEEELEGRPADDDNVVVVGEGEEEEQDDCTSSNRG
jgi:hypothetical protein